MSKKERTLFSGSQIPHGLLNQKQPQVTSTATTLASAALSTVPALTNISIISNSRLLREGLVEILVPHMALELVGSYAASAHVPAPLTNPANHVVLIDGSADLAILQTWITYWRSLTPPALTIILELINDSALVLACIEAGASSYVLRGASAAEVAQAITLVQQGLAHSTPDVTARMYARLAEYRRADQHSQKVQTILTAREQEVLQCIAAGYSNQEIAHHLVIGVRTVKHHVHNILEKLKLHSRWEAAHLAVEQGWFEIDRS